VACGHEIRPLDYHVVSVVYYHLIFVGTPHEVDCLRHKEILCSLRVQPNLLEFCLFGCFLDRCALAGPLPENNDAFSSALEHAGQGVYLLAKMTSCSLGSNFYFEVGCKGSVEAVALVFLLFEDDFFSGGLSDKF
jgi:hypothetical protein